MEIETKNEHSPSALPAEPTEGELREKLQKVREQAAREGKFDLPATPIGDTQAAKVPLVAQVGAASESALWEPPCVTCGAPIGYRCLVGRYGSQAECKNCLAGSISQRLAASGIAFSEVARTLDELKPHGSDGKPYSGDWSRYVRFLRAFATLKPKERLAPPFGFVCGSNGVGKSAGAQRALAAAIRDNGCQGRVLRLSQILDSIYSTYGSDEERTAERMSFYGRLHLLVVEEVGQETSSDHAMSRFFELVDDRLQNRMPTIFTSNYLPREDSLGARITERTEDATRMHGILDRIRGGCGDQIFVITGASWRRVA